MARGDVDRWFEICADLADQPGLPHIVGVSSMLYMLPAAGRAEEARAIAEDALAVTRAHGNPMWVAWALQGYGRAFTATDPARALSAFRQARVLAQEQRIPFVEARVAQESAGLEAVEGDLETGLELFDTAIDSFHRGGDDVDLAAVLADLTVFFDRVEQPEVAATIYGTSTHYAETTWVMNLAAAVEHLRAVLGETRFEERVAAGTAMEPAEAVRYAHDQIQLARQTPHLT